MSSAMPSSGGSSKPASAPIFTSVSIASGAVLYLVLAAVGRVDAANCSQMVLVASGRSLAIGGGAAAAGAFEGQLLEPEVRVGPLFGGHLRPAAFTVEGPGQGVVGHVDVEDLLEPGLQVLVEDRGHGLNP